MDLKKVGGAPRKYNAEELAKQIEDYILTFFPRRVVHGDGDNTYLTEELGLPAVEDFCFKHGISKDTVYRLAKESELLSYALERLKIVQATKLINKALNNEWNSNIAKLILSANHGMKETSVKELTGKDGEAIQVNTLTDEERQLIRNATNESTGTSGDGSQ